MKQTLLVKTCNKKCLYGHKHENTHKKWCDRKVFIAGKETDCKQELKEVLE